MSLAGLRMELFVLSWRHVAHGDEEAIGQGRQLNWVVKVPI